MAQRNIFRQFSARIFSLPLQTVFTVVTETIMQRIESGAIRVWGKVGGVVPPHLVLPMTIEPQKPRLCIEARFLNLKMADTPFSLENAGWRS